MARANLTTSRPVSVLRAAPLAHKGCARPVLRCEQALAQDAFDWAHRDDTRASNVVRLPLRHASMARFELPASRAGCPSDQS